MAPLVDLTYNQVVLLATTLATESDLTRLQILAAVRKDVLNPSLIYRLLLSYLPTELENSDSLSTFLDHLQHGFVNVSEIDASIDTSAVDNLSSAQLNQRIHGLRLVQTDESVEDTTDSFSTFLIQWTHHIEATNGLAPSITETLEPFREGHADLKHWFNTYLTPLLRLQNDFYPGRADTLSLDIMEQMHGAVGVKILLQFAEQDGDNAQIRRDLDEVVSPWVYGASQSKRRRTGEKSISDSKTSWQDVNEWIYTISQGNLKLAAKAIDEWGGPEQTGLMYTTIQSNLETDTQLRYAQTALAMIMISSALDGEGTAILRRLLQRAITLATPSVTSALARETGLVTEAGRASLLVNALLNDRNPLTMPSESSYKLLQNCIDSQETLQSFRLPISIHSIADITLFGTQQQQEHELSKILQQIPRITTSYTDWNSVREKLHSLRGSGAKNNESRSENLHLLSRVEEDKLEVELLDAIIAAGQYAVVSSIYLDAAEPPLPQDMVREHIVGAIFNAYDNASNGNRTRGGMKRAYEMLKAFESKFAKLASFSKIHHLIKGTHSLSFYHLTLQHGVPFQPVNIRVHNDPVVLIGKVLEQNPKAYTQLDDLIEIGRSLVFAALPADDDPSAGQKSTEENLFEASYRITYLAITSALSVHDFDTAYSYITTRLSTSPTQKTSTGFVDDMSWRAAYAAGKYRPPQSSKAQSLHDRISSLSKRMDLLSLALTLVPSPESLSEILATWRRSEEEMDSLRAQAVEEERALDAHGTAGSTLPGGFGPEDRELDAAETRRVMERRAMGGGLNGPTYEEEAPMGLFDVARGAARAIGRSAFPLRGASGQQVHVRQQSSSYNDTPRTSMDETVDDSDGQQRVRKRDMVSNMVTGGLVSGMSWVLGAPPKNHSDE